MNVGKDTNLSYERNLQVIYVSYLPRVGGESKLLPPLLPT